jgi:hypothetical protein
LLAQYYYPTLSTLLQLPNEKGIKLSLEHASERILNPAASARLTLWHSETHVANHINSLGINARARTLSR